MTTAPNQTEKPTSGPDKAGTRRLNDQLRRKGRGGVVTVSLSIAAAGEDAIAEVLAAVAAAAIPNEMVTGDTGHVMTRFGRVFWSIVKARGARILTVWHSADG